MGWGPGFALQADGLIGSIPIFSTKSNGLDGWIRRTTSNCSIMSAVMEHGLHNVSALQLVTGQRVLHMRIAVRPTYNSGSWVNWSNHVAVTHEYALALGVQIPRFPPFYTGVF